MDPRSRDERAYSQRIKINSASKSPISYTRILGAFIGVMTVIFLIYFTTRTPTKANEGYTARLEEQYSVAQQEIIDLKNALAKANKATDDANFRCNAARDDGFKTGFASRNQEIKELQDRLKTTSPLRGSTPSRPSP